MHLGKGKSDQKDAQWIMRYGQQHELKIWQPEQALLVECRQLEQVIEQLIKPKTMTSNSWQALQRQLVKSRLAIKSLLLTLKTLEKQIQQMEDQLQDNLGTLFGKEMKLLRSSPGIGDKTAGMLLLFAGGFGILPTTSVNCQSRFITSGVHFRIQHPGQSENNKDGREPDPK